jgi:hypothetical protein
LCPVACLQVRETLAEEYKMDTVANKDKIKELVNE